MSKHDDGSRAGMPPGGRGRRRMSRTTRLRAGGLLVIFIYGFFCYGLGMGAGWVLWGGAE